MHLKGVSIAFEFICSGKLKKNMKGKERNGKEHKHVKCTTCHLNKSYFELLQMLSAIFKY